MQSAQPIGDEIGLECLRAFAEGVPPQTPWLLWIGCADSRVSEIFVENAVPGEIFVHRNIANQFHPSDDSARSVLAYGVNALNIPHIAVVGHTHCGGAEAALKASKEPPSESPGNTPLARWLRPLTEIARRLNSKPLPDEEALNRLIEEGVRVQVSNVAKTDTIRNAWNDDKDVVVHGWVFDMENKKLRDIISVSKDTAA